MQGKLDNCPACGSSAFVQRFNEECYFATCGNEHCSLSYAEITKWTVFENKESAIKHWNEVCQEVRDGMLCPSCQNQFLDTLEIDVFYCSRCKTITEKGKLLSKEKYIEYMDKYELPEPIYFDWCCIRNEEKNEM